MIKVERELLKDIYKENKMFVIARRDGNEVYYTGKKYMFQGEYYACIDNIDNAKKYNSEKLVKRSLDSLIKNVSLVMNFISKKYNQIIHL